MRGMVRAVAGQRWTPVVVMATICCSSALFACLASAEDAPRVSMLRGVPGGAGDLGAPAAKHAIPSPARCVAPRAGCCSLRVIMQSAGPAALPCQMPSLTTRRTHALCVPMRRARRSGLSLRSAAREEDASSAPLSLRSGWALKGAGRCVRFLPMGAKSVLVLEMCACPLPSLHSSCTRVLSAKRHVRSCPARPHRAHEAAPEADECLSQGPQDETEDGMVLEKKSVNSENSARRIRGLPCGCPSPACAKQRYATALLPSLLCTHTLSLSLTRSYKRVAA
jgi:hypothetical protein